MPDVELTPLADGAASHSVDRRTLLVGAAGTVAAAGLSACARGGTCRAAGASVPPALSSRVGRRSRAHFCSLRRIV
jgi:hypothetical protein